jgi:hypothetical protein
MKNAKTVGDLMDRLATLPRDMPLHQRGKTLGSFDVGVTARVTRLAPHESEPGFHADLSDRIWGKTGRKGFGEPFEALVIE